MVPVGVWGSCGPCWVGVWGSCGPCWGVGELWSLLGCGGVVVPVGVWGSCGPCWGVGELWSLLGCCVLPLAELCVGISMYMASSTQLLFCHSLWGVCVSPGHIVKAQAI